MLQGPPDQVLQAVARPAGPCALEWLRRSPALSVAWSCPARGVRSAGLGVAAESSRPGGLAVRWLGEAPPSVPGPVFGGWAFDAARSWEGFPAERWLVPEVLAWEAAGRTWVAALGEREAGLGERLAELEAASSSGTVLGPVAAGWPRPGGVRGGGAEERGAFEALVEDALAALRGGWATKLVVARELVVDVEAPVGEILATLEALNPSCWTFLVRGPRGQLFLGSTPELLCEASGDVLVSEALAGTGERGRGEALLRSEKDRREHELVIDGIWEALTPYAAHVEHGPTGLRELSSLVHLHTPFRARLKPGVAPLEVARALHPTPAVCGRPRGAAQEWLRAREPVVRGWYAGVVGAVGAERLTLAVALRSALLVGARARVFVGAGIVAGSRPAAEWRETERKAAPTLLALSGGAPVVPQPALRLATGVGRG